MEFPADSGVAGRRRRALSLFAALVTLCTLWGAAPASAQDLPPLQLQRFRPAAGPTDYIGVYGTGVPRHLTVDASFYLDFADAPLEIPFGTQYQEVVDGQNTLYATVNIGLFDRFEVSAVVPVTLLQSSEDLSPITDPNPIQPRLKRPALNDQRINAKWQILDPLLDPLGVAMVSSLYIPLSTRDALTSDEGVGFDVRAVAESWIVRGIRVALNVGYRFRSSRRQIAAAVIGDEILWGMGANFPLFIGDLDALLEVDGAVGIAKKRPGLRGVRPEEVPTELRVAARYALSDDWTITAGLGFGLTDGFGAPDVRGFVGIGGYWVSGGKWGFDYDADGIFGYHDECPDASEDYDGHEDLDGCPDPDNDGDGVPDERDRCDNTPEGFEIGEDGCPDDDLDGDGIPNKFDECPEDAEDLDGFEDADGCPDIDNDADGIPDSADECPGEKENFNDFQDEDGCPDDPNQRVVVGEDNIIIMDQVNFATNQAKILSDSYPTLDEVARVLKENPQLERVRIEGHTDDRGSADYNQKLSQRRANSVRKYLIERGINPDRLEAVGYGESQPIADNDTEEGRAKNRRSEFVILERSDR
jgi:outer membrane protein OmpA-like peptidoglycan-associated protein